MIDTFLMSFNRIYGPMVIQSVYPWNSQADGLCAILRDPNFWSTIISDEWMVPNAAHCAKKLQAGC